MDMRDAVSGTYVKAVDCDPPVKRYIDYVAMEEVGPRKENKYVLHFRDENKGLVLNKTNSAILIQAFGAESKNWFGCKVELYAGDTTFEGRPVKGTMIRNCVKSPAIEEAERAQEIHPQDDVPF